MSDPAVTCGGCGAPLTREAYFGSGLVPCGRCGTSSRVAIFPAFFSASIEGERPSLRAAEEASCFYHPDKRARVPCDSCGRFLCSLCDIEVGTRHLCTGCLEASAKGGEAALDTERVLHDSITLTLALSPVLFWPVTPITAPLAVYRAFRYWNKPGSLVRRSRWRLIVGGLVGVSEIVAMVVLAIVLSS